jgi:1-acyl-sn-glycerol-3-phosphate acyltransferase
MEDLQKKTKTLANDLVFELNKSLGFKKGGLSHGIIKPLVWKPMVRFSELATHFEHRLVQEGFQRASAWFISHFVDRVEVIGEENIPPEGPLIVAANHPGAYDSLVITSRVPRDDIKIISSDIPFIKKLPITSKHIIFTTLEPSARMGAARKAIRHLKNGGSL